MDTTRPSTDTATPSARPPSVYSTATTLAANPDTAKDPAQPQRETPVRYVYSERSGPPNPDAQPKPASKMSKLLSKFQSPAVQRTVAAQEREKLEEERTGVKKTAALEATSGSTQSTAAYMF